MGREGTVAVQGRGFLAPGFSRGTYRFARVIGRTYMRLLLGVRKTEITGMEHVHAAMLRFQKGETRLMVLFRHVGVADGPLVIKMLSQDLERWSRAQRKPLLRPPHAHFLYGKDALNWAGAMARWSFPRMGGIPVVNGRIDRQSQTTLRRTLTTGEFPLAFAPEGQVTYHQFRTFEMTAGAGTLAHWTYRDLRAAEDLTTRVEILPVAIGYSSRERDASVLREIVRRIEIAVGREATRGAAPKSGEADIPDTAKLLELTRAVVSQIEREFPFARQTGAGKDDEPLQNRIDGLCDAALRCGERAVGLSGEGSTLERVFRLRNWRISPQ